jgi:hypothetical protein
MVDWRVLVDAGTVGSYKGLEKRTTTSKDLTLWFVEALLTADPRGCVFVEELTKVPSAFPFDLNVHFSDVEASSHLEIQRDGSRRALVLLK